VDGRLAYPIAGFTYIIVQGPKANASDFSCIRRREVMKFFNYVLTNPELARQTVALGYTFVSDAIVDRIFTSLLNDFECDGNNLVGVFTMDRGVGAQIAIWAVDGFIFFAATISLCLTGTLSFPLPSFLPLSIN